jgi:nitrogen-specific signal transduction histidine kinase/ActR/RegA family two-component response regulator
MIATAGDSILTFSEPADVRPAPERLPETSKMKTILVLAHHPELADAIRTALDPERFRVVHRIDVAEAEPLLDHALIHFCVVDAPVVDTAGMWVFERIRRRVPHAPIVVFCDDAKWALEEEAYLAGVKHVLRKPVRARMLEAVLEQTHGVPATTGQAPAAPSVPVRLTPVPEVPIRPPNEATLRSLQKWREFSSLLASSLSAESLLKQFLLQLREITGVGRAAIFLRQPVLAISHARNMDAGRFLRSAHAIGLSSSIVDQLELSLETGVGGHIHRHGRILWRDSLEAQNDSEIAREFAVLNMQVVVPILDRQTLVGLLALDGRITGEPLSREELEIIFHLLGEMGLAIRNVWFHDQLLANQEMLTGILRQFNSGCIVVGRDLNILHCNDAARKFLVGSKRAVELQFSDLPVVLGSKIYQVLKSGAALAPFRFQPADTQKSVFQISIVPLQTRPGALPDSALMVVEDHTQAEQLHTLEVETNNLRLIKSMADRLAHEIGNALVPISTHQQLIGDQFLDPDFRNSLEEALAEGVKRISRLVNQMRFLARDVVAGEETFPLGPVVEEAFREAQTHQQVKSALLKYDSNVPAPIVCGDRAALKHAFLEIFLNALQANPKNAKISVKMKIDQGFNGKGRRLAEVEVHDNGAGFTPETALKVPAPFFTTRTVGLGLGLTVSRKIIETHQGKLEIPSPADVDHGVVRVFLPQSSN